MSWSDWSEFWRLQAVVRRIAGLFSQLECWYVICVAVLISSCSMAVVLSTENCQKQFRLNCARQPWLHSLDGDAMWNCIIYSCWFVKWIRVRMNLGLRLRFGAVYGLWHVVTMCARPRVKSGLRICGSADVVCENIPYYPQSAFYHCPLPGGVTKHRTGRIVRTGPQNRYILRLFSSHSHLTPVMQALAA